MGHPCAILKPVEVSVKSQVYCKSDARRFEVQEFNAYMVLLQLIQCVHIKGKMYVFAAQMLYFLVQIYMSTLCREREIFDLIICANDSRN